MKRAICILLILSLLLCSMPVMGEELAEEAFDGFEDVAVPYRDYDELVVGHTTRQNGNFFGDVFGNNTADIDVWSLIHGYHLVKWDVEVGMYGFQPTVVGGSLTSVDTETNNRIYTLSLLPDLYYCDGTQITARDYAFAIMLTAAPQVKEIGGNVRGSEAIEGMDAFKSGETHVLSGVKLLSDSVLEIEIKAEYLPFFYEHGLLNYTPYPISVIAPGCEVADDGEGVYIRDIGETEGPSALFTAELLNRTLLDPKTGYVSHPTVTSGPYRLTEYDAENAVSYFEINEYYKGNNNLIKPTIPRLVYRQVENETVISDLQDDTIDLFNKAVLAETIDEGMQLVASGGDFAVSNYAREGFSFVSYCCERPLMASQAVRQAIAYCMDEEAFLERYVRNYGVRVYGYYGLGQWMFQMVEGSVEPPAPDSETATEEELAAYEETLLQWEELTLDNLKHYDLDLAEAVRLLEEDGWKLNTYGEPFDPETDDVRCKLIGDEIIPLELSLIYPEGNIFGEAVQSVFIDNLEQIGVKLTASPMPFVELLQVYYRQVERNVDMIYLASNFTVVFEPSTVFNPDDAETGMLNRTGIADQELYELAVDMRKTEPGDILTYCTKWVAFQERWAEVLPAIPMYSNVYFDFYTASLQNYLIGSTVNWGYAVVPAFMSDYMPEPEEETEEEEPELEDGEEIFED